MKTVKEWKEESIHQCVVKERYVSNGNIRVVQRIKDDAIFGIGKYRCAVYFKIVAFNEDLIRVKIMCGSSVDPHTTLILNCQINDIEISDDGNKVVSWIGVTEDGYTTIDDTPEIEE